MPDSAVFVYNCTEIKAVKKALRRGEAQTIVGKRSKGKGCLSRQHWSV